MNTETNAGNEGISPHFSVPVKDLSPVFRTYGESKVVGACKDKILRANTKVANSSEQIMKDSLLLSGITAYYEPHTFIASNLFNAYLPDFVTSMTIDGKPVIIERHGKCSEGELKKFNDMRKLYGFYMVVISSKPAQMDVHRYVDEYWFIENGSVHGKGEKKEQMEIDEFVEDIFMRSKLNSELLNRTLAIAIDIDSEKRAEAKAKKIEEKEKQKQKKAKGEIARSQGERLKEVLRTDQHATVSEIRAA